jgi:hypothetical protein
MGSAKTYRREQSSAKERRAHTSGPKETFPTDESSVGSNEESSRKEVASDLGPIDFASQPSAARFDHVASCIVNADHSIM